MKQYTKIIDRRTLIEMDNNILLAIAFYLIACMALATAIVAITMAIFKVSSYLVYTVFAVLYEFDPLVKEHINR